MTYADDIDSSDSFEDDILQSKSALNQEFQTENLKLKDQGIKGRSLMSNMISDH